MTGPHTNERTRRGRPVLVLDLGERFALRSPYSGRPSAAWVPGEDPVPAWVLRGVPCADRACGLPNPHAHKP